MEEIYFKLGNIEGSIEVEKHLKTPDIDKEVHDYLREEYPYEIEKYDYYWSKNIADL